MKHPDFRTAFRDGATIRTDFLGECRIETRTVGRLVVTTGRLVACDPLVFPETRPFRRRVLPGRYPVVVSIVHISSREQKESFDQRIACGMLRLGRRTPVAWQVAVSTGQSLRKLKEDEFYGYPVDSGTGCFMDHAAAKTLDRRMGEDYNYFNHLINAKRAVYVHTRGWADFQLDPKTGLNVVLFSSGFGDGTYPSYWGFDREGNIACLVTDFDVLERTSQFTTVHEVE
jgi:hypothetical protein